VKKEGFMESTIIATICLIIIKVLGVLYVIPFYAIVGVQGAALYAYAYNIYGLFLEISTIGIPNAISKLVNEYNTLNNQEAKIRTFNFGKIILGFISVISFIILFIFAPQIGELILGDLTGGNTIEDVSFVIRCVSFALLIFPFLSVTRGFFQGHRVIHVSSFSQVIEQVVRVFFIIVGSYIALKWLKLDLTHVVGVSVFSAFVAGSVALLYVNKKLKRNKKEFNLDKVYSEKDNVSNKEIIKKIFIYAVPAVIVSIAFSIYNNIDMILVLRTMNYLGFDAIDVEFISTAISTWCSKISIIITTIAMGMMPGLIAAMVEAFTLKNYKEVNNKFNKAMEINIFITLPMCVGISLLSSAVWTIFYGYNPLGTSTLAMCIFAPFFSNMFTISNYTLQSINRFKMVYICAIGGILINALLDVPFMLLFDLLGIPAYFGATFASIVGFSTTVIITMLVLKKSYNFKYGDILKTIKSCLVPLGTMILVVLLMKSFLPVNYNSRFSSFVYLIVVVLVGALSYFIVAKKMGLVNHILGDDFLLKIKNKFIKNKKEV